MKKTLTVLLYTAGFVAFFWLTIKLPYPSYNVIKTIHDTVAIHDTTIVHDTVTTETNIRNNKGDIYIGGK